MDNVSPNKKIYIVIAVVLLVALGAGFLIYKDARKHALSGALEIPRLDRPITVVGMPDDAAAAIRDTITKLEVKLKDNPRDTESWLNLAAYRKVAGDNAAAEEIWRYLAASHPDFATPYANLGDLYSSQHQNVQAETYFRLAIAKDPTYLQAYYSLADLYLYELKDTAKALSVLQDGVSHNPHDISLLVRLARLYKQLGNKTLAQKYYTEAISVAKAVQRTDVVASLQKEQKSNVVIR